MLVTYLSRSGNTRSIAEAIYSGLDGHKELKLMREVEDLEAYDMVFVGFPIIGAGAPRAARSFLAKMPPGKKVALFLTHGMPGDMEKLRPMVEKCKIAAQGKDLVGVYNCQGKLAPFMAVVLRLYPDRDVRRWVAAGGDGIGIGHPNHEEVAKAVDFGRTLSSAN